jgi:hypothetical protein
VCGRKRGLGHGKCMRCEGFALARREKRVMGRQGVVRGRVGVASSLWRDEMTGRRARHSSGDVAEGFS